MLLIKLYECCRNRRSSSCFMVTKTGTIPQAWFLESLWLALLFFVILSIRVSERVFQSSELIVSRVQSREFQETRVTSKRVQSAVCWLLFLFLVFVSVRIEEIQERVSREQIVSRESFKRAKGFKREFESIEFQESRVSRDQSYIQKSSQTDLQSKKYAASILVFQSSISIKTASKKNQERRLR